MRWRTTTHAAERWYERVLHHDGSMPQRLDLPTKMEIARHCGRATQVPLRFLAVPLGMHAGRRTQGKKAGGRQRMRVGPRATFLCTQRGVVITLVETPLDVLAATVVWLITGEWVAEDHSQLTRGGVVR